MTEKEYRVFVRSLNCTEMDFPPQENREHAIAGICGEAGELAGVLKAFKYYNTLTLGEMKEKLKDEAGDLYWYLTCLTNWLDIDYDELVLRNVTKLRTRFPEGKFSKHGVINKDKDAEQTKVKYSADQRKALEESR